MSKTRFSLYRYQLLPKDRYFQGDLYGPASVEELIKQKNDIFADALRAPTTFKSERYEVTAQKSFDEENFFLFRIAINRSVNLETKDFGSRSVSNWPKFLVAIWNDPEIQLIAVQHRTQAFQKPASVIKLLMKSLESSLVRHQLVSATEPLFEKRLFWELIHKNKGKIRKVEFELVTPNMASISRMLPEDLKAFAKRTNAVKSKLVLESDPSSALVLDAGDETVDGLAAYTSEGGGNVSISVGNLKKRISTSKTTKEIELQDAKLEGSAEEIAEILKSLMMQ